jgi:hypothetical protein
MITDPQAIRFVNEAIRPLCEQLRALKANIDSATYQWNGTIAALIPNDVAEKLEDGRAAEGVSRLTGADIRAVVAILAAVRTAVTDATVSKPCVRPLVTTG